MPSKKLLKDWGSFAFLNCLTKIEIWRGNNVTSTSANIIQFQSYTLHRVLQLSSKLSLTTHWDILLGGITRSGSIFKLELILKWILSLHQVHMKHYCMHINWSRWDKQTGSNFLGPRSRWKKIIACLTIKLAAGFADPRRNLVDSPQSLKSTTKQPAVGGPKSLETKKLGSLKGWEDQSAEKTNNWKDKKYITNRWDTKKLNILLKTETTVHCEIIHLWRGNLVCMCSYPC